MEINQLRYFCAVARTGSFTRAAEQLGIAQPSLSQQIRVLEKQVSTPLFERLGRSVRLTAYGEALYQPALAILQQVTEAQAAIFELQQGVKGHLRIGVIPTIMPYLLAPHAGRFVDRFPDLDVQFVEDTTPNLLERLQSGDLDIAVASLPVRNRDIVCSELFREPLLVALCDRSEEHTSELQSHVNLVCRLLLEKKKKIKRNNLSSKKKKKNKTKTPQ